MKAKDLLKTNISVEKRADDFITSITRNIQKKVLDKLSEAIEKIDDQLFEKKDFSLETNVNSGTSAISRAEAEQRFTDIINLEFDKVMLAQELSIKQASFDKYFKDEVQITEV